MQTTQHIKKYILTAAITLALSNSGHAAIQPLALMNVQPTAVYQSAAGASLKATLDKVASRSGIVFKVKTDLSTDVLLKTVSADSWETAIAQLLDGYNYAVIKDGSKIAQVIIIGRGEFGAMNTAPQLEESKLLTVAPIHEILPEKYQAYPAGSVVKIALPVEELMAVADATDITLDLPMGKMAVTHSRTVAEQDGSNTWVGFMKNEGAGYSVFVSQGPAGVMGHILTPDGTYTLETANNGIYLIDNNKLTDVGFKGDTLAHSVLGNADVVDTTALPDPNPQTTPVLDTLTKLAKLAIDAQSTYNAAVAALTNAQTALVNASNAVTPLKTKVATDDTAVTAATTAVATATAGLNAAKLALEPATANVNAAKAALIAENGVRSKLTTDVSTAQTAVQAASTAYNNATTAYNAAAAAYIKSPTAANLTARTNAATVRNTALTAFSAASTQMTKATNAVSAEISVYNALNTKLITASTAFSLANANVNNGNVALAQKQGVLKIAKSLYDNDLLALNAANAALNAAQSTLSKAQNAVNVAKTALDTANNNYKLASNDNASAPATEIDVMVVYTTKSQTADFAKQRINYLITASNQAYMDSGVKLSLRLVHTEPTTYVENNSNTTALYDLAKNVGAFFGIEQIRAQYGADLVYLFRPLWAATAGSCGTTFVEFANGSAPVAGFGYGTISDGAGKDVASSYCRINTFTHEIGHSLGLVHDVEYSSAAGVFPDAYAWGVTGKFATIMSYKSPVTLLFSNPDLATQCAGQPCGTSTTNQAKALRYTGPIVAKFMMKTTTTPVLK